MVTVLANLSHLLPELLILMTLLGILLVEANYGEKETERSFSLALGSIGVLLASVVLFKLLLKGNAHSVFTNSFIVDGTSNFLKLVMCIGTLGIMYLGSCSKEIYSNLKSEFYALVVAVLFGGMILSSANDLLMTYIGIETLSILSYVLASFKKNNVRSAEAGLKYLIYGAAASGVMLFGMSHIYGTLGTINFSEFAPKLAFLKSTELYVIIPSLLCFFVGLAYKISAAPFHMWSPDVYEGSPTPVTGFFAIVPKLAGMMILLRVTHAFWSEGSLVSTIWLQLLLFSSILTMFVGNISAIGQSSVKRMLAYSSIGHAGVMMMGAIAHSKMGADSLLFYALVYTFMSLVAFYIVGLVTDHYGNDYFERFNGLIYRYPLLSVSLIMVMFSLAGIPPFSGFVAKFNLISSAVDQKHYTWAVMAVLNSVISLYYYTKIVRCMVFKSPEGSEVIEGFTLTNRVLIVILVIPVIVLGLFWNKVITLAGNASFLSY